MLSFVLDLYCPLESVSWSVLQLSSFEDSTSLFCTWTAHGCGADFLNMMFIKIINILVYLQLLLWS